MHPVITPTNKLPAKEADRPRTLSYVDAVREATDREMARDPSVILFGLDVDDPKAIQGTTRGLAAKYGPERVFGTPLSEDAMTGAAIGMALAGLRPIHVHIRMDFLMLAMNQLINVAAKSRYMYGGQVSMPLVVRSMIGKSWGQGAQHSQGLNSFFMHVPGLKVVAPATPFDAKGCLIAAIRDDNPVLFVEHRLLHFQSGPVPEGTYLVPQGKARITAAGADVTLVGISSMQTECLGAHHYLRGDRSCLAEPARPGHHYGIGRKNRQATGGRQRLGLLWGRRRDRCRSGGAPHGRARRPRPPHGLCPRPLSDHAGSRRAVLSQRTDHSGGGPRPGRGYKYGLGP
jgi:pyruvate/2-oxoglutarate/acetoin dehydrogenase E1 component